LETPAAVSKGVQGGLARNRGVKIVTYPTVCSVQPLCKIITIREFARRGIEVVLEVEVALKILVLVNMLGGLRVWLGSKVGPRAKGCPDF
jgi:hypothetical protein